MLDQDGNLKSDNASITEFSRKFNEEMYRSRSTASADMATINADAEGSTPTAQRSTTAEQSIPPFSDEELQDTLRHLKSGKAKDSKQFVAEMLKGGGTNLRNALLQLMNAVTAKEAPTPTEWLKSILKMLLKGGDGKQAKNYHPVCVMQLLYKLLAVLLQKSFSPTLDAQLSK